MSLKITQLPRADHIDGVVLEKNQTPQTSLVRVQYTSAHTGICEVVMDVPNALYLLNALEAISADHGYDDLRRPPK